MEEISKVKEVLEKPLAEEGYTLVSVKLSKNKDGLTLALVVDKDTPISMDDIVSVSNLINPLLDEADPIKGPYTLDVSSLGAEKPIALEKLDKYVGQYVNLHLLHPYKGLNIIEGTLEKVDEEVVITYFVKGRKTSASFERKNVDKARLAIKF